MYVTARTQATRGFTLSPGGHLSHACAPVSSNPGVGKAYHVQCSAATSQIALQELGGPNKPIIFKIGKYSYLMKTEAI